MGLGGYDYKLNKKSKVYNGYARKSTDSPDIHRSDFNAFIMPKFEAGLLQFLSDITINYNIYINANLGALSIVTEISHIDV